MRITPAFFDKAKKLRAEFEENFKNPLLAHEKRFVWDYWYVENQYQHFRTPAYYYFSTKLYETFHRDLVLWGRKNLGCWDVSPPWLSYYITGCQQNIHQDVPHGPWAFVYSLTLNPKKFSGGETLIYDQMNPLVFTSSNRLRTMSAKQVSPKFNQLLVFDPRIPHGVSAVKGTMDPQKARLVIHGWFTEPKTYVDGPLKVKALTVEKTLNSALDRVQQFSTTCAPLLGTLAIRINVSGKDGRVTGLTFPTHNLWSEDKNKSSGQTLKAVRDIYSHLQFPKMNAPSSLTIPLLFSN